MSLQQKRRKQVTRYNGREKREAWVKCRAAASVVGARDGGTAKLAEEVARTQSTVRRWARAHVLLTWIQAYLRADGWIENKYKVTADSYRQFAEAVKRLQAVVRRDSTYAEREALAEETFEFYTARRLRDALSPEHFATAGYIMKTNEIPIAVVYGLMCEAADERASVQLLADRLESDHAQTLSDQWRYTFEKAYKQNTALVTKFFDIPDAIRAAAKAFIEAVEAYI